MLIDSIQKKIVEKPKVCLLCKMPANWYEWSPDGETDYFCSEAHYKINRDYLWAKGLSWRASPLRKYERKNNSN
jgi:hypothetical protein